MMNSKTQRHTIGSSSVHTNESGKTSNVDSACKTASKSKCSNVESTLRMVISQGGGISLDQRSEQIIDEHLNSPSISDDSDTEATITQSVREIYKKMSVEEKFSTVLLSHSKSEVKIQRSSRTRQKIDTKCVLSPLEAIGIVSVLEDTIDQLGILKYLLPGSTLSWNQGYKTIEERFGVEDKEEKLFPCEANETVLTDLIKMQRDRTFVESALRSTVNNLLSTSTFESLQEIIDTTKQMKLEEDQLIMETKENIEEANRLRYLLVHDLTDIQDQLNLRAEMIVHLKDRLHDEMVRSQIEYRYVDRWQKARESQHQRTLMTKELELSNNITNIQRDIDQENRSNSEIEHFIAQKQQELGEQIELWMDRFDRESEEMEAALFKAKMDRETNMQAFIKLQNLFKAHREDMDEWLDFKTRRRAEELRKEILEKMAIRIQTWWRTMTFRHNLGPFRKKGGKKGQGKGKGAKEKGGNKKKK